MAKRSVIALILLAAVAAAASAEERGQFGLGAVFGEPTGITAKQFLSEDVALDLTVYWSFVENDTFYLHFDYLEHADTLFSLEVEGLRFYAGIGGMVQLSANPKFGARIPFGITYFIPDLPVEIFLEVGPLIHLYPEITPSGTAGLGLRYYF
jgi:hypothetical protein